MIPNKVSIEGVPIRYGQPEPWKVVAAQIGRTKPTRATQSQEKRRKKNDGRPPDTIKDLVKPQTETKKKKIQQQLKFEAIAPKTKTISLTLGLPSYPWRNNSCWLDTSLELTFITMIRHFSAFSACCEGLPTESGLRTIYESFEKRRLIKSDDEKCSATLGNQRDEIRTMLKEKKLINDLDSVQPLFVSYALTNNA